MDWPGGIWEEFGWTAALTTLYCLVAVALGDVARKEAPRLLAYVARRSPYPPTWRGLARAIAALWE